MSGALRFLGLTSDRKPFRDRLLPWWTYGVAALFGLGIALPFALIGWGFEYPDRARVGGLAVLLPLGLLMLVFAVVARKHQRR